MQEEKTQKLGLDLVSGPVCLGTSVVPGEEHGPGLHKLNSPGAQFSRLSDGNNSTLFLRIQQSA